MHFVREIFLRNVKYAAACEGIYFISHSALSEYFTIYTVNYFTFCDSKIFHFFAFYPQKQCLQNI